MAKDRDWLEIGITLAGVVVVLGLFVEYGPDIATHRLSFAAIVGSAMVTGGVFAEVLLGIFINRKAKRDEARNAALLTESRERAADALKTAAESNRVAEQLRLERAKLEADLSPRFFKNQHHAIEHLKAFQGTTAVLEYPPDLECHQTAEQIAFVLTQAGWTLTPRPNPILNPIAARGVTVDGPMGFSAPAAGSALVEELNQTGIDASFPPGIPGRRPEVLIIVGMKLSPREKAVHANIAAMHQAVLDALKEAGEPDLEPFQRALLDGVTVLGPGAHGCRLQLPGG